MGKVALLQWSEPFPGWLRGLVQLGPACARRVQRGASSVRARARTQSVNNAIRQRTGARLAPNLLAERNLSSY